MKLASLKHGRDGRLVVVSDDLSGCADATDIAPTLQAALDDWASIEPKLRMRAEALARDAVAKEQFQQGDCASPLPRAYQWVDGSAYVNHVELVRRARGAEMPQSFWTDPLMYQGGSDDFLAPHDPIVLQDPSWGCDFEAEVAVVLDDVPMSVSPEEACRHIKLILLVNDVSLRNLIPGELAKGFGFYQSKPSSSFSPLAVTPDALAPHWRGAKLHLPLISRLNGALFGKPNAGCDMTFDFGQLIAHAARTRALRAGTILGSGTVSNRDPDGSPGRPVQAGGLGYSCIAEIRMVETITSGAPRTPFLTYGDRVQIEMLDPLGHSIFGSIDQTIRGR